MTDSDREPGFDESRDGTERATKIVEAEGLPDENPFTPVVEKLRENGEPWRDIFDTMDDVFSLVDKAALEEGWELVPEWHVAAVEYDEQSTSGERYEFYERTAETATEAETMVERHTGCRVESEKTEQVGVSKVS